MLSSNAIGTLRSVCHLRWSRVGQAASLCVMLGLNCLSLERCAAQEPRYELGVRERRYELAWNDATSEQRAAATGHLEKAVSAFFSLRLSDAMRSLDEAWFAVANIDSESLAHRAACFTPSPTVLWLEATSATTQVRLVAAYEPTQTIDSNASVSWKLVSSQDPSRVLAERTTTFAEATSGVDWELGAIESGDHRLLVSISEEDQTYEFPSLLLSASADRTARLEKLTNDIRSLNDEATKPPASSLATLSSVRSLLARIADGSREECDYPADRLLAQCEALVASKGDLKAMLSQHAGLDQWLSLSSDRRRVSIRLKSPQDTSKPLPVLIAFHGAGGSENMFFETYGAGRLVEMGLERGYLVVAPRQGLTGVGLDIAQILDVLETLYEIDRTRVFLVGHSMGAAQSLNQVSKHPQLVRGVAAVGGGGSVGNAEALAEVPFFVAAGDRDFGRRGVENLHRSLERRSVESTLVIYPETEHLGVMQVSLDDVFAFFDKCLEE